jgi:uncharacterized protein (TIGR02145 family)
VYKRWIYPVILTGFLSVLTCSCREPDNPIIIPPFPEGLTDIDGNVYDSVIIGTQIWMVQNLKVSRYNNGEFINYVIDKTIWDSQKKGGYCNYDNDPNIAKDYGRLYNWYAVMDSRKICPSGWHVPSLSEWNTLVDFVGGVQVAGIKLKEAGTEHWELSDYHVKNESGFTGLPGGYRWYYGVYDDLHANGLWWSTTEYDSSEANAFRLNWAAEEALYRTAEKFYGHSVRCLKD